ncbi:MAG: helix-turn-helix domain-containing protein [Cytophagaceae bacterium]|jgi:transcriptional regulator with XRE-family HTH domain|nr:helix-turn-helix domain-containing protein [Cytophagaceae bacterium]
MDETIVNRLLILMETFGYTAGAFADKIDVQRSSISHLMSGRNKPSLDFIQKVLTHFPDINPLWLIMGKGPMKQLNLFDEVGKVASPEPIPVNVWKESEEAPTYGKPKSSDTTTAAVTTSYPIVSSSLNSPNSTSSAPIPAESSSLTSEKSISVPETTHVTTSEQSVGSSPQPIPPTAPLAVSSVLTEPISSPVTPSAPKASGKKAVRIVFFYDDNTFETFFPSN